MLISTSNIGIISDDFTGANDTALQFHVRGCNTQVILDYNCDFVATPNTQAWAVSTESRNISPEEAKERVGKITKNFIEKLHIEHLYKKIDSTLRGNISVEILEMLDILGWDASIILPAYPDEGRMTMGGYHLLRGIPLERTEVARDPLSPIFDSYIPTVLNRNLSEEQKNLIGRIGFDTVIKGAGPVLLNINKLIEAGKKMIIVDAASNVDIEQVVLAIEKSSYKILPCGSAGMAKALSKIWVPELTNHEVTKVIPQSPKLVVSGSATKLVAQQLQAVKNSEEFENTYFIPLTMNDILDGLSNEIIEKIKENLKDNNIVVVHSSDITLDEEALSRALFEHDYTKEKFISKIVDYLAELTKVITDQKEVILIIVGGETSFRCCKTIGSKSLQIVDAITPAIPLTLDMDAQWIVTKSGNLGNNNTLVEVLKYLKKYE